MNHEHITGDVLEGVGIGTLLSAGMASLWPETIHGLAVVVTAILGAVAVFFTNRLLRKKFPEGN